MPGFFWNSAVRVTGAMPTISMVSPGLMSPLASAEILMPRGAAALGDGSILGRILDPLAERLAVGPEFLGERLVNDRDGRAAGRLASVAVNGRPRRRGRPTVLK